MRFALYPDKKNLILAGIIIGIAMMDRATVALTLIPAAIILWQNSGIMDSFKKMSSVSLISLLIISPWLVRNYRMDGIIGFESSAAKNIWKGVLFGSDGSNYLLNGENYYSALSEEEKIGLGKMSPLEQSNFFNDKYNKIWINDPGHVVKMFFLKLKNFWWFRSGAGTEWGSWQKFLPVYKIFYGISLLSLIYFL
jgi:4-amino-4-deoxy-L-arabinose transferase-like glycosyltransferase